MFESLSRLCSEENDIWGWAQTDLYRSGTALKPWSTAFRRTYLRLRQPKILLSCPHPTKTRKNLKQNNYSVDSLALIINLPAFRLIVADDW